MEEKKGTTESQLVLIVEDKESTRVLIRTVLEQAGFRVEEAVDGLSALEAFERYRPDAVLLDVVMPGMDGYLTCSELRKLPSSEHIPIIMTTGLNDIDSINQAYEVGATDFITKPINHVILTHRLRYMLRGMRIQKEIAERAIRDPLTGLYNRRYFATRILEELNRAKREKEQLGIFLCDLDHFKTINDTLGHHFGDKILKMAAKAIQDCFRGHDLVFRWGGDEIVVILPKFNTQDETKPAERIRAAVQGVDKALSLDFNLDVSIGISIYPDHASHPDELIRLADRALYIAKRGQGKIQVGEEAYHLDDSAILAVFQPIVCLKTLEVQAYEALVRDPKGELSVFALFNKYAAIGKLRELKALCMKTQIKAAEALGLKKVFVNADFNLLEYIEEIPKPPGLEVIIEISELEALRDVEQNLVLVEKWRNQGYRFAIDDFGAGFISLPFIALASPEFIKLDRSTLLLAVSSEKFRTFLNHLIEALSYYTPEGIIAEGIETEEELEIIKNMGVPLGQGYLLGRPQNIEQQ